MSTTSDPRRRRWVRLVMVTAVVRGTCSGVARAVIDWLLT